MKNGVLQLKIGGFTKVILPNKLKRIGQNAFYEGNLQQVDLPETIESIGKAAFYDNYIEEVNIPGNLSTIEQGCFAFNKIREVELPVTITKIEKEAFLGNDIQEVVIPSSVRNIESKAFGSNINLKYVAILNKNAEIADDAFKTEIMGLTNNNKRYKFKEYLEKDYLSNLKIDDITIFGYKDSTAQKYAEKNGFNFSYVINIDGLVYKIDEDSKTAIIIGLDGEENSNNETLTIPETINIDEKIYTVEKVGNGALENSNFTNIELPSTIKVIGSRAFENCKKLEDIILPENLEKLEDNVFSGCSALKGIYIPKNVSKIGENILENQTNERGTSIYGYSNSKASQYANDNNIKFVNIEEPDESDIKKYGKDNLEIINGLIYYIAKDSDNAQLISKKDNMVLKILKNDINIKIPEEIEHNSKKYKVNSIEPYALKDGTFKSIEILSNIEKIKEGAFDSCEQFVIEGYSGSYAEEYAKANNIEFKSIGAVQHTNWILNWGVDNYNFINGNSYFSSYTIGDFKNYIDNCLREKYDLDAKENEFWSGSCSGISVTNILFKFHYLTPSYWQNDNKNAENVYQLDDTSKNERLLWLINFYQIFQGYVKDAMFSNIDIKDIEYNSDIQNEILGFYEGVKDFYNNNDQNKTELLICNFFWNEFNGYNTESYGHEIVIAGIPEENTNGFLYNGSNYKYRIPVYDVNNNIPEFIYIDDSFSKVSFGTEDSLYNEGFSVNASQDISAGELVEINAYRFDPRNVVNLEEIIKNNGVIEDFGNVSATFDVETAVKISDKNNNYAKIKNCKIEEGNLQCKINPVLGITADKNNKITKNDVFFDGGDWYSIETENETDKLNADMYFGDSFMTVSTQSGAKAVFEDKKSVILSNYSGNEYETTLTLNEEFVTLPWYTVKVKGKDSKKVKLEMKDEGVLIEGDSLKNVTVIGKNSVGSTETNINTDNNSVLLKANDDSTKLIAYIDTNNDGDFETALDSMENSDKDSNDNDLYNDKDTEQEDQNSAEVDNDEVEEVKNDTKIDNPKTDDNIIFSIVVAIISAILFVGLIIIEKYYNI